MGVSAQQRINVATFLFIALAAASVPALAQRGQSSFKKGDKVEANDGFDWKPGTVVGVSRLGRIEVRLDDVEMPEGVPREIREQVATRSFGEEVCVQAADRPLGDALAG